MLQTTVDLFRAGLKTDPTVSPALRKRILLALLRDGADAPTEKAPPPLEVRLLRRVEAARRLGCSVRMIDRLAAQGVLPKRRLPGRVRASGVLLADLEALILARPAESTPEPSTEPQEAGRRAP